MYLYKVVAWELSVEFLVAGCQNLTNEDIITKWLYGTSVAIFIRILQTHLNDLSNFQTSNMAA